VETHQRVEQALSGTARSYGKGHFTAYLRSQEQYPARENDVRNSLRILDKEGTLARQLGLKKRRKGGEFITRGPDWLWCIDGHDKFRPWGVFIYAAVDAFSRRIIWLTVSNDNRKGVVILKQMITAVRQYNRCPRFYRSDRGNEVLLLADAHYSFYTEYKRSQGLTDEQLAAIKPHHCYMFGTSMANIRIESVWQRMIAAQTADWLVCAPLYFNVS